MMFLCSKCPKIFLDKKQLAYHQRYHVMVESPCENKIVAKIKVVLRM